MDEQAPVEAAAKSLSTEELEETETHGKSFWIEESAEDPMENQFPD